MTETVDRYEIDDDNAEEHTLCPWTLKRDSREIAHFTTENRAIDYRDYLIERRKDDNAD